MLFFLLGFIKGLACVIPLTEKNRRSCYVVVMLISLLTWPDYSTQLFNQMLVYMFVWQYFVDVDSRYNKLTLSPLDNVGEPYPISWGT